MTMTFSGGAMLPWPPHDGLTWIVVLAVALAGGALRGLTGFGSALLMAPVLSVVLSARETMCLVTLLNAIPMGRGAAPSALADRDIVVPMTLAGIAGIPVGISLVGALSPRGFGVAVGVAVMLSALALMSGRTLRVRSRRLSAGVGALSGVLTGCGGVGGPPAILYVLGIEPDAGRARATFVVFFAWLYPVTLLAIAALGLLSGRDLAVAALAAPFFLAGGWGGSRLYRRLDAARFRPAVLALLVLAGLVAAWPK